MIREAIAQAAEGMDLSQNQMAAAMEEIMEGRATPAQIGALLIALKVKGECLDEIAGAAQVMRAKAETVPTLTRAQGGRLLDIVGAGGDGAGTFNVSTTSAFVAAGAGARVAKHGNRAVSSSCGSADLVAALGVSLDLSPVEIGACIDQAGIGFLFAPALHPAMAHAAPPRREIGLRSIFNLLGPLTNPAGPDVLLVGVYDRKLTTPLAGVLGRLGAVSALVVHGHGGLDEISISGPSWVSRLQDGEVTEEMVAPRDFGVEPAALEGISGGDPETCRRQTLAVLAGEPGPRRDVVLMNAGAALMAAGLAADYQQGAQMAAAAIDSGAAMAKLEALIAMAPSDAGQPCARTGA